MTKRWLTLPKKPYLTVIVDRGVGEPLTMRLAVRQLERAITVASAIFLFLALGTLLFFRQVSENRRLSDRLLSLELSQSLGVAQRTASLLANGASVKETEVTAVAPAASVAGAAPREVAQTAAVNGSGEAAPRLIEATPECSEGTCRLRFSLGTDRGAIAEGHLLVVLEATVPRIGSSAPDAAPRKKYLVYPGNRSFDELKDTDLAQLAGRPFHFSRSLQGVAEFQVGAVLRPLAMNVYVYGKDNSLLRHERRAVGALGE